MADNLQLDVDGRELSVRRFSIHEALGDTFRVLVWANVRDPDLDLEALVGAPAKLTLRTDRHQRCWRGGVAHIELLHPEPAGESAYLVELRPALWFSTQVRGRRIFQHMKAVAIVEAVLGPYGVEPVCELGEAYQDHEYVVQYGESDYQLVCRLLAEEGIDYFFRFGASLEVVFSDAVAEGPLRPGDPIHYVDEPQPEAHQDYLTRVRLTYRVQPGKVAIRDFSFRKKLDYPLLESKQADRDHDYEQYYYAPGSMLVEQGGTGSLVADDEGVARHEQSVGRAKAERWLTSARRDYRTVAFTTNAFDLAPGVVFCMAHHPHSDLSESTKLLVTQMTIAGSTTGVWIATGEAGLAADGHRPTPRAKGAISGVQSAIVTGPPGEEIYTDEYGRVRVQLQWDREGKGISEGKAATKWLRVSQSWAGRRFGTMMIPRIGHEVLVRYFEGDPELPAVVGRVHNKIQPVPYPLPKHRIKSVLKSDTTPHADGAYNEIRLDDRHGLELFYAQAQRDRQSLVRRHCFERTGVNRVDLVGGNRSTIVAGVDATMVGSSYSLQMIEPPSTEALHLLEQRMPKLDPTNTKLAIEDGKIATTTGDATIEIEGGEVMLEAKGDITIKGRMVIIEGGPKVKINCGASPGGTAAGGGGIAVGPGTKRGFFTWLAEQRGLGNGRKVPKQNGADVSSMLSAFGDETQQTVRGSPTLSKQLGELEKDGWVVDKGPAGKGSFADRSAKKIVVAGGQTPEHMMQEDR